MTEQPIHFMEKNTDIYEEMADWDVNAGGEKVVAKRMSGRYRNLKWFGMSVWLIYFLVPYVRWKGEQAVLLDIPNRQFRFFELTIFPQDIWMLSLTLLFFAILLAAVTSVAGRVFCGYFCFQTVWTDIYTWIEGKLEGDTPQKQLRFKQAPLSAKKVLKKVSKHSLWMAIALLTGLTFSAWFTDAFGLWRDVFSLQAHAAVWVVMAVFTTFTYVFAGFMREQVCFWLCPYARLQGVMYDVNTVLPAYDAERGEPRGKLKKGQTDPTRGSCIDCKLCVNVCPTGIDIRKGQQEGCITCGLCIDACDSVMDKINEPRGLIRYASYAELQGRSQTQPIYKRPRVLIYAFILLLSLSGIGYGFMTLSPTDFRVTPDRQPLFVRLSDGSIQNRYTLKLLNQENRPIEVRYLVEGLDGATVYGIDETYTILPAKVQTLTALVKVPEDQLQPGISPLTFKVEVLEGTQADIRYDTIFIAPE